MEAIRRWWNETEPVRLAGIVAAVLAALVPFGVLGEVQVAGLVGFVAALAAVWGAIQKDTYTPSMAVGAVVAAFAAVESFFPGLLTDSQEQGIIALVTVLVGAELARSKAYAPASVQGTPTPR